jgi:tRNA-2-methylthio-N6-dimethylallyladenosine synthase
MLQDKISEEDNQAFLGQSVEVLVEGPSKTSLRKHEDGPTLQLTGRTPCDRIVVFEGTERQIGQLLPVTIYEVAPFTLFGTVVTQEVGPEVYGLTLS